MTQGRQAVYRGIVTGMSTVVIDPISGLANFSALQFSLSGKAALVFSCASRPADFQLSFIDTVIVQDVGYLPPAPEVAKSVRLRFSGDYSTVARGEETYIETALYNSLWNSYENVTLGGFNITEGMKFNRKELSCYIV